MKELLTRSLTGAVFIVVMLIAVWWSVISLSFLLLIIMSLAITEFLFLKGFKNDTILRFFSIIIGIFILTATILLATKIISSSTFLLSGLSILLLILLFALKYKEAFTKHFVVLLSICFYIILPISLVPFLSYNYISLSYDPTLILSILVIIWVYDSFAYLAGVSFGMHKMFPAISPKKSWEGFIGGIVFALLAALIISTFNTSYGVFQWVVISLIIAIAGTAGDFFESYLKRKAGVKDSGDWLPGHGGILDRFDSFLFAVPFVFIFVKLII